MVTGLSSRHAAEEEARAEVDVLKSHLEKRAGLTKKIEAQLARVQGTGRRLNEAVAPLNGETKQLQILCNNIDGVLSAIGRLRQQSDSKNDEEQVMRMGPEKAGLSHYLTSLKRLNKALAEMKASNLRSTQQTTADLQKLIKSGNTQLENYFDKLIRTETPRSIEPLHFITKQQPFPVLSQDKNTRLGLLNSYISGAHRESGVAQESPTVKMYAEVRGPYLSATLVNLAQASVNTAKRKDATSIYRAGTSGISTYAQAMEGLFIAEYETICRIFTREDWGPVFQSTCQAPLAELARTLRELNVHIRQYLNTDCFLAYEIVEVMSSLSNNLETKTGELKASFAAALKPVKETAKSSLAELLETMRTNVNGLQTLPPNGAPIPIVSEIMQRLQAMVDFMRPMSIIMVSLGDGGWRSSSAAASGAGDSVPNLASFDIGADGKEIFANYCADTIEALFSALDARARMIYGRKPVVGVFMANNIAITERMIRDSDLAPLLEQKLPVIIDNWRKKANATYTDVCKDVSIHLLDVIHTSRANRPTSGQGVVDSASIMKGLSSKDREKIKDKFQAFNASFDDMVTKHKQYSMEPEVRRMFAKAVQQTVEPLYNRFWDRYHEIDKGKGKYAKYDKSSIAAVFHTLY
ncbi:Exocyst complex protein exo70 [Cytospora mali]|uniref:Exocyst complex protein EXO70 n=1 Tax=Cytospora mali TaxID=578113 RepID=A0A194V8R4_CYTMA|nr:Exocyst complex protein exo70 [Valsa mali var. pyri (nom. inval.)]